MKLRRVEESDINEIVSYEEKYFHTSLGYDYIKIQLENPYAYYILLEDDGKLLGYLGMTLEEQAEIQNFFIVDLYRGKGYSKVLLENGIIEAKSKDVKSIYLEVSVENAKAIHLYEGFGFKKSFVRKGYYNGVDAIVMMKEMF